ncbi:MAG: hypothetical protein P8L18_04940 [Verrucomicrobiota bacterium]|nr:hypothetical protein [Verrucomicrobiota bacterium]
MKFVSRHQWLAVIAASPVLCLLAGCGGVGASGGASPSALLFPGIVGHEVDESGEHTPGLPSLEAFPPPSVSNHFVRPTVRLHPRTQTDPS